MEKGPGKAEVLGKVSEALSDQRTARSNGETKASFMEEVAFQLSEKNV